MIDTFGRKINYLRISVTERCNLRCRYCMPEEGICKKTHEEMLTEDELISCVRAAVSLGMTKFRLTGGEPLVKRNLLSICKRITEIPGVEELCLTTNATLLPDTAEDLVRAGVSRVNISLDTLDPRKYAWITRRGSLREALDGVDAALHAGFAKVKLNAVLIGGFNDDEIPALADLTRKWPVDMRFIEMMPMAGNTEFGPEAYIPYTRVLEALPELVPVSNKSASGLAGSLPGGMPEQNGVAKLYRLPGALGNVGLISPVNAHFCRTCSRLRLTADGKLKPCLHSEAEYPVKGLDEEEMKKQFAAAIYGKPEWHGNLSVTERSHALRRMNQIGG